MQVQTQKDHAVLLEKFICPIFLLYYESEEEPKSTVLHYQPSILFSNF